MFQQGWLASRPATSVPAPLLGAHAGVLGLNPVLGSQRVWGPRLAPSAGAVSARSGKPQPDPRARNTWVLGSSARTTTSSCAEDCTTMALLVRGLAIGGFVDMLEETG
jgi:hypothetical protein